MAGCRIKFVVKAAAVGGLFIVHRPAAYIRAMTRYHTADAPPFFATIGYVRGLKIGHLDIWCEGKREGGWPCYHKQNVDRGLAGRDDLGVDPAAVAL
jgi:hypothetical protein